MHYYDSHGVFRVYDWSIDASSWKLWRDTPGFSQRFVDNSPLPVGDRYLYAGLGTTVALGPKPVAGADEHGSSAFFDETDLQTYRCFMTSRAMVGDDHHAGGGGT
jgi:hypothetical protein